MYECRLTLGSLLFESGLSLGSTFESFLDHALSHIKEFEGEPRVSPDLNNSEPRVSPDLNNSEPRLKQ